MALEVVDELQADYEGVAYVDELTLFYRWWTHIRLDVLTVDSCFSQFYQLEKVLADPLIKSLVRDIQEHIFAEFWKDFFSIIYLSLYIAQVMLLAYPVSLQKKLVRKG